MGGMLARMGRRCVALATATLLLAARPVVAVDVTFEPPAGRPGSVVAVDVECAEGPDGGHAGPPFDAVLFARHVARVEVGTGYIDGSDPVLREFPSVGLTFVGPGSTFTVPRVPAGRYYLYLQCYEADLLNDLLPPFRVLGAPDTSTEPPSRGDGDDRWILLVGSMVGLCAVWAFRMTTRRTRPAAPRGRSGC